ncbi:GCN5 family acetyltransferase [Comamonas testosteroni]|uniref:GCN5 family acetyltransferase n=1 Tax=Comamonas testosteroni TaxID=285 RepID=UPI00265DFDC5|nr:GCN5 family acetyltransferase [Comamonas testosteroni]WKL16542.1 GCN5 family acetyltransferase [Comamonas testosteroni]
MRGLLAVALAKRIGQPLTVDVAREVVAECLPDLSVGAVAVERRGDLVFQAEQLGPDPAAGELAAQRLRFLEETLPHGVPAKVQWDELRQIERSGQLLILTVRRDGVLLGSVWLNLYQDLNTGEPVACDDMLFIEQGARGGLTVVHLWRYAERVLEHLGRVQMSCHSREANNAGRLARFVGGQITHTGFSKRIGCGQERAQRAGKD